ncbi:hypothetical protein BDN70DRAFT_989133 [Pholiota conissans]|uniref:MYND-type domain-containing protein n=1 Tax=Pholiota conissans TaxID=109636 RepID=A0A9P5ZDE4_9AGAR|nr:hypothetical protein BDN70DRAFT_989133 [Pholiota conissans]
MDSFAQMMSALNELELEEKKRKLKLSSTLIMKHPRESMDHQSPKEIKKAAKDSTRRTCVRCCTLEPKDVPFKACGGCHSAFYCSKECQKLDWAYHKRSCLTAQKQRRLEKLGGALVSNRTLFSYLNLAIILSLGLHKNPSPPSFFTAHVTLVIEPEDIIDFGRLQGQIGDEPPTRNAAGKIKGMLQIGTVTPLPDNMGLGSEEDLRRRTEVVFQENSTKYAPDCIVGSIVLTLFDLGNFSQPNPVNGLQVPTIIDADMILIARMAEPFHLILPSTGEVHEKPMAVFSCMEYINMAIRQDHNNRFLLRTEMLKSEEKNILDTASAAYRKEDVQEFAWMCIRRRMECESVYQALRMWKKDQNRRQSLA